MQAINNTYPIEIVNILLSVGVDPNKIDSNEKKALDYAISRNLKEMINILLPITQTR
jgi:ankyrin repeat protein